MKPPSHELPRDAHEGGQEPRWLRLAATLRAAPDPATLAHVRARLAARAAGPAWVRWLARPAVLAACAGLLLVSAWTGSAMLSAGRTVAAGADEDSSLMSTLLGDDGSYGVPLEHDASGDVADPDSDGVER
jgi:hypothetical protein